MQDVDALLIDLLVYQRTELVQEALELLISRHCQRQRMLTNLIRTQLVVVSTTVERFDKSMDLLVRLFVRRCVLVIPSLDTKCVCERISHQVPLWSIAAGAIRA